MHLASIQFDVTNKSELRCMQDVTNCGMPKLLLTRYSLMPPTGTDAPFGQRSCVKRYYITF